MIGCAFAAADAAACELAASAGSVHLGHPSDGRVSVMFGMVRHPVLGRKRLHTGWDYAAARGVPVRAAASGRVVQAGWSGPYGNRVVIDHGGGLQTAYAHLKQIAVAGGACVEKGSRIGDVGSTGLSSGAHLHFETRQDGRVTDPAAWLGKPDQ
jgi:murein DD-endopeptidase MepM/ murein hydrolase activator NlpD